jgi:hypothetical protein
MGARVMAAEALRWLDGAWSGDLAIGHLNDGQRAEWHLEDVAAAASHAASSAARRNHQAAMRPAPVPPDAPLLALYGLPPAVAEPITLLAEILGWRVAARLCGGALKARLCLAMLPARSATETASILAWSTDNILNEHISRQALSIMEQPLSVSRLELLLQETGRAGTVD